MLSLTTSFGGEIVTFGVEMDSPGSPLVPGIPGIPGGPMSPFIPFCPSESCQSSVLKMKTLICMNAKPPIF